MKKLFIFLSIVLVTSCSYLSNNDKKSTEAINKAEKEATSQIAKFADDEVLRAERDINKAITEAISKADTTLNNKILAVKQDISREAETTKKDLGDRMKKLEDRITRAYVVGIIGIVVGITGAFIAILAYKKRPETDVSEVKKIIKIEIANNENGKIKCNNSKSSDYRQQNISPQLLIEQAIKEYATSDNFRDLITNIISSNNIPTSNIITEVHSPNVVQEPIKKVYELFAKESSTMVLSNIQDSYQKGKSIYKLILTEPNSNTAQIVLCVDKEEVKQIIIKLDSQYLEPICNVTRLSNDPNEIIIKANGLAERSGEDWRVIKPVIVEIK